ncbi:hypothetical protein PUNSTDRAFT_123350 [Punctularia strigosozonata HHB-11173 SS5]|uniref:uncharacterized protein n=1 Tax=Punctularia strigosozonata (strain HHB-11173) TaxID=741275 RepID=UPI000441842E|nr:uncharacterized protein PUNSTDRAFT_123350 [Punctularia strigosozonata HHB-11173 SS5]EIN13191.1 hypothetical protein PUNSTDRAFT_123350 [Punctularia strigosozonata HHB-11173 SS5]
MLPTSMSPTSLQQHLYASLLQGHTADVALRVRGSWDAVYKLHRVVLIQSGFFRSMFTSGFSESKHRFASHIAGPDQVDIVFDDPNITRAAFEICIARLYGGGPTLHVSPALVPTPAYPLTTAFPYALPPDTSTDAPEGEHPATPRFLLSLLATAVYLSIPSVAAQALGAIMSSMGPHTVVRYLNFAIGRGIGAPGEQDHEPEAAVGLEHVAHTISESQTPGIASPALKSEDDGFEHADLADDLGHLSLDHEKIKKEDPSSSDALSVASEDSQEETADERAFDYGAVGTKIGEAAACWLARWGRDVLTYELSVSPSPSSSSATSQIASSSDHSAAGPSRPRSYTLPTTPALSSLSPVQSDPEGRTLDVPRIWRRGGLTAKWASAVLASDMLFVRDEKERYEMAKEIVELRRREGIDEGEEKEWENMFADGIYYCNMMMEDLIAISHELSPATHKPYISPSLIHAAHWTQSLLRHHITAPSSFSPSSSYSSSPASPPPRDKELGLQLTTADVLAKIASPEIRDSTRSEAYYAVAGDASQRIGDSTGLEGATIEELLDPPSVSSTQSSSKRAVHAVTSEATFFGLAPSRFHLSPTSSPSISPPPSGRWTRFPPCRFAVEFWDVDALKEKSRLHSRTVFYAGSLWNVYVQVVRKKDTASTSNRGGKGTVQLGVYLHRQSTVDPVPAASAPATSVAPAPTPAHTSSRAEHQTHSRDRGGSMPALTPSISLPAPRPSGLATLLHPSRSSTPAPPPTPTAQQRSTTPVSSPTRAHFVGSLPSSLPSPTASGSGLRHTNTSVAYAPALPVTAPSPAPPQPYRDPRPSVAAYFSIACASATGAALTRFTSAPDVFSVSQSWGWKSSSLRTEEYIELGEGEMPVPAGREASLRATVVLGVV